MAEALYDHVVGTFPESTQAAEALSSHAWMIEEDRPEEALRLWSCAIQRYPSREMLGQYREAVQEINRIIDERSRGVNERREMP